jgi:hypothetical protein
MLVRNATSAQLPGVIVDDTNLTRIADRRTQPAVQAEPHDQSIPTSTTGEEAANAQKQPPAPGSVFAAPPAKDAASAQQAPEPVPHVAIATADLVPGIRIEVPDPAKPQDPSRPATPWGAAADAGVGIGRGSQKAAVATAGFFSKLGKSIARSF